MPRDLFAENGINPGAQPQATGPVDLFQKHNISPNEVMTSSPALGDAPAGDQFLNGVGDALTNTFTAGLKDPHRGSGLAYGAGELGGDIAGFLGGGELLDSVRLAAKGLPYIGKAASALEGTPLRDSLKRIVGGGLYGADTNPDDRTMGAAKGSILSGASEVPPQVMDFFRPGKYAQQILQNLGQGRTLEENQKSLAQDLSGAFNKRLNEGYAMYHPVMEAVGNNKIYSGSWQRNGTSLYAGLDKDIFNDYDRSTKNIHFDFGKNPTFQNAHSLQSQLGYLIRRMESQDARGILTLADKSKMQGFQSARSALKTDMDTFLKNKDVSLANQYSSATKNWEENVSNYFDNPGISKIVKEAITNPKNLSNLFRSPEPEVQKIVDDMGPDAKNKILYDELGKASNRGDHEELLKTFDRLEDKRMDYYITPDIAKQFSELRNRANNLKVASLGTSSLLKSVNSKIPIGDIAEKLSGAAYRPLMNSVLATTIPGGRQ